MTHIPIRMRSRAHLTSLRAAGDPLVSKGVPVLKTKLIDRIAITNPHLRWSDTERTVNAILEEITAALARGDRVELRGVGAFTVRLRRDRPGRNPKSGAEVVVPEKRFPHFRPGKPMHDRLSNGRTDPRRAKPYNLKIISFFGFRRRALSAPRPA
jgi:integration host factor subunit beta